MELYRKIRSPECSTETPAAIRPRTTLIKNSKRGNPAASENKSINDAQWPRKIQSPCIKGVKKKLR